MERAYGSWEGRAHDEIERDLAHEYEAHSAEPWDYAMPGGESRTTLDGRLLAWLATLDHENTHVVVTHSGCVRALRGIYTKASREEILAYREPQTASFLLSTGHETMIGIPLSILRARLQGEGRPVGSERRRSDVGSSRARLRALSCRSRPNRKRAIPEECLMHQP